MFTRRKFLALCAASPAMPLRADDAEPYVAAQPHMGCLWTVKLYAPPEKAAAAATDVFAKIAELDAALSDYRPDSELMKLCAAAGKGPQPVSDVLFRVLQQSREASEQSDGMFDITLGPCTRLWRASRKARKLPDRETLDAARKLVDWRAVKLDPERRTAELTLLGMQLDAGGIAKGFAQDECLALLRKKHNITAALIDAAGEVAVGTAPPGRKKWTVALEPMKGGAPDAAAELADVTEAAVATSGDLHQSVEISGTRYSHIVDPRTGLGMTQRAQVSLIAPGAALADWLATALCLLDEEKGRKLLAKHPGAEARVQKEGADGKRSEWRSPGLAALLRRK